MGFVLRLVDPRKARIEVIVNRTAFCIAVCCVCLAGELQAQQNRNQEPTELSKPGPGQSSTESSIDRQYQEWVARLSPEQQAWELVLQAELGTFYLPRHKSDKVAGISNAWDFVEDDPALPRILLIGDSISRAYTLTVREKLAGRANVHRAPANCGPVSTGLAKLDVWLGDGQWDVIHFNFGIHNRNTPVDEYSQQLDQLVSRLKETEALLVWANTTPIPDDPANGMKNGSIVSLNAAAARIMAKHDVKIDDLYTAMAPQVDSLRLPNDVHYTEEGNALLGRCVSKYLLQLPELDVDQESREPGSTSQTVEKDKRHHSVSSPWGLKLGKPNDTDLPRVLLIGDSIMNGYRHQVASELSEEAIVDAWVTPHFQSEKLNGLLKDVLSGREYEVVHFNVGLHGWQEGRIKPADFKPLTRSFVEVIREKQPNAKLIWASSTPITVKDKPLELDPEATPRIVQHNRLAAEVMVAMGVPINDFYGLLVDKLHLARGDMYHWNRPAYKILGDKATRAIRTALAQQHRQEVLPSLSGN